MTRPRIAVLCVAVFAALWLAVSVGYIKGERDEAARAARREALQYQHARRLLEIAVERHNEENDTKRLAQGQLPGLYADKAREK